jgi:hypothetical protein
VGWFSSASGAGAEGGGRAGCTGRVIESCFFAFSNLATPLLSKTG